MSSLPSLIAPSSDSGGVDVVSHLLVTIDSIQLTSTSQPHFEVNVRRRHLSRETASWVQQLPHSMPFPAPCSLNPLTNHLTKVLKGDLFSPLTLVVGIPKQGGYSHFGTAEVTLADISSLAHSQAHTLQLPLLSSKPGFPNLLIQCNNAIPLCRERTKGAERNPASVAGVV